MDELLGALPMKDISLVTVIVAVAIAVITDKLVWHTRLRAAEVRADRWEKMALEALSAGARAGVKAAEVTVDVVSALPDPARESPGGGRERS